MAEIDPSGRYSNRPIDSLQRVFAPWYPQTPLDNKRRLDVIDGLRRRHRDIAWTLMLAGLPQMMAFSHPTYAARFRTWKPPDPTVTMREYWEFVQALSHRLAEDAGQDPGRWKVLCEKLDDLPPNLRASWLDRLAAMATDKSLEEEGSGLLWETLHGLVAKHREFNDAKWRLPDGEIDAIEAVADLLKPTSPLMQHRWLFADHMPSLDGIRRLENLAEYEQLLRDLRAKAIAEIAASAEWNEIVRLATGSKDPIAEARSPELRRPRLTIASAASSDLIATHVGTLWITAKHTFGSCTISVPASRSIFAWKEGAIGSLAGISHGVTAIRDHIFISYGTEDQDLAGWLALKLISAGFPVWFDQYKLLGGEPFPVDIDRAIKERTFRMISVMSKLTIDKPNPRKERTAALNVGKALNIPDFIIPIKAAELGAIDLNWQVSDLTWIDFSVNWADGFRRLLRKLESVNAPRAASDGNEAVTAWYASNDDVIRRRPERLWSNVVEFLEFPTVVYRVQPAGELALVWPSDWPRVVDDLGCWVFEIPDFDAKDIVVKPTLWQEEAGQAGSLVRRGVSNLFRQYVLRRARAKGLVQREDNSAYFPFGLLEKNKVKYVGRREKATTKIMAMERSFRVGNDRRDHFWALQAFQPRVDLRSILGRPSVRFALELFLTQPGGAALDDKKAHRWRRRLCKRWYNAEWLDRLLALVSFLADGNESVNLAAGPTARIVLGGRPFELEAPHGINEAALGSEVVVELDDLGDDEEVTA